MSPTFSLADSSDSMLAVDAGEKHTVSSENSNGSIKSDISLESNSESATEPSSLEPTTSLDVDQDCRAHILAEDPFDSDASRALFDAIDKFQSCGANSEVGTPQVSNLTNHYLSRYPLTYTLPACGCRVPVSREVFIASEFNGHTVCRRRKLLYSFCNSHSVTSDRARHSQ